MRTARNLKQNMQYALKGAEIPIVDYYTDSEGNKILIETGETKQGYFTPVPFSASINNKLDEVLIKEFGVDDSTKFSQIVTAKGVLPLTIGSLIWKKSEVQWEDAEETYPKRESADYVVMGVADEGLNIDLFLLQRNVK